MPGFGTPPPPQPREVGRGGTEAGRRTPGWDGAWGGRSRWEGATHASCAVSLSAGASVVQRIGAGRLRIYQRPHHRAIPHPRLAFVTKGGGWAVLKVDAA